MSDSPVALLFGDLNRVVVVTAAVVAQVPLMSYEEVVQTEQYAAEIGAGAWRIQCACRAELLRRARQTADVRAAVEEIRSDLGIPKTLLYVDAAVQEALLAEPIPGAETLSLTYHREAVRAPDPRSALELAVARKEADVAFSTRDMRHLVDELRAGADPEALAACVAEPVRDVGRVEDAPVWLGGGVVVFGPAVLERAGIAAGDRVDITARDGYVTVRKV